MRKQFVTGLSSLALVLAAGCAAVQTLPGDNLTGNLEVVSVVPPTGDREADRTNIQAAFDTVQPGGTVQFAAGTYVLGAGARLTVSDVTVLGHPEGTILRGCDPEAFAPDKFEEVQIVFGCTGLYVQAARQTIRGLTFEYTWHGIVVGPYPTTVEDARALQESGKRLPPAYPAGGHRIEGNTFRASPNGLRVLGTGDEVSVVRDNDFIDVFHAIGIYGAPLHFLDNRVTVEEPARVPFKGYPGSAIIVSPGQTDCTGHVVAGNRIEGYPDAIYMLVNRGGTCRGVEIRDNTIRVRRVMVPEAWVGATPTYEDSTMVGVPITLMNRMEPVPGVLEHALVQGNRIIGAEGLGILARNASHNRIEGNTITGIERREPYPGMNWGFPPAWEAANGSGIWVSAGSDENEILGNLFEDIAAYAVVLEGARNRVQIRSASDAVRDLGSDHRVNGPSTTAEPPPSRTIEAAAVRDTVRYSVIIEGHPWAERRMWQEAPDTWRYEYEGPGFYGHLTPGVEQLTLDAAGIPVGMAVSLPGPSVQERFERDDRRARWSVSRNDGPGSMSSRTVEQDEVEICGPAYYSPVHRIHDVGVVARALLRQPNGVLPLLPEGEARLEPLGTRTVEADGRIRTVRHYAVRGGDLKPAYVWLDADGATFADEWSILAGWEPVFSELRAETAAALAEHHRHLAAGLVPPARERPLVIRGASLFDPHTGAVRSGTTIVVEGNRIAAVGADHGAEAPAGAEVIEAAGRMVLPGLWDMHAYHGISQDYLELEAPLRLAAGVTTARDMGSPPEAMRSLRQRIEAGDALGPRLLLGGLIEGTGGPPLGLLASDADEARAAVDRYAEMGYVQIKTYNRLPADVIRAVTERARHHGLRMSGHVPPGMTLGETVESGFDEAQHINQIFRHLALPEMGVEAEAALGPDSEAGRRFIDLLVARGAAIDPNLGDAYLGRCQQRAWVEEVASRLPALAARRFRAGIALWACPHPRMDEALANMSGLVRAAHEAGVPVLPGAIMSPGFGLHTELDEYAAAGIPAPEVLTLATLGAARVMGMDADLGSVEPGKLADLILVEGDPTTDISDIRRVVLVVRDGRVYDPAGIYRALGIRPCCEE